MNAPFRPPQLAAKWPDIEVWNALLSRSGQPMPLAQVKGGSVAFAAASPPSETADVVELRTGKGPEFLVAMQSFPFKKLFGGDFRVTELQELPLPLQLVLREGMLASLAPALPADMFGAVEIKSAGPLSRFEAAARGQFHWLAIAVTGVCPEPVNLLAGASLANFARLFAAPPSGLRNWTGLKQGLKLPAWFSIGEINLRLEELRALRPADFVVLSEIAVGQCHLRAGDSIYALHLNGSVLTCTGKTRQRAQQRFSTAFPKANHMNDAAAAQAMGAQGLSDLPLVIDFDIGQIEVTLAEAESWQPGSVVKLAPPALADGVEVTLRCNNQIIAVGELMRIDERLAVRLTRLVAGV